MAKISVIIPVHNAGEYLRPCVESVQKQTLRPDEIILVIDAPTDGSDAVAQQLAKADGSIRVLRHTTNSHIGLSRNDGLQAAKGDFVAFVDHDDLCEPQMLSRLYDAIGASGAEIALSPVGEIAVAQGASSQQSAVSSQQSAISEPITERTALLKDTLGQGGAGSFDPQTALVVGGLFRRSSISGLRFADTRTTSAEDWLFLTEALHAAERVVWVNETLYRHRTTSTNTGATSEYVGAHTRVNTVAQAFAQWQAWPDKQQWLPTLQMGASKMIVRSLPALWTKDYKEAIRLYRVQSWLKELFREEMLPPAQGWLGKLYRRIIVSALTR